METIAPDKPVVTPQLPGIVDEPPRHPLARGDAPEDEDFSGQERGIRSEVNKSAAAQPGAIEQDRFRREVFEPGAGTDLQGNVDGGIGPVRAIDLLGRLRGDMRRCVGSDIDADGEAIAADKPARGGEEDGNRRLARRRVREEDAQRIMLVEMTEAGAPVPRDEADLGDAGGYDAVYGAPQIPLAPPGRGRDPRRRRGRVRGCGRNRSIGTSILAVAPPPHPNLSPRGEETRPRISLARPHHQLIPPSTASVWPVTMAPPAARKSIASAMSAGGDMRGVGGLSARARVFSSRP